MNYTKLQSQYDKIYSYFRTTCEPFDFLEWDGKILQVWDSNALISAHHLKEVGDILRDK
ncbi:MAG: hypothetical protein ACD_11C00147G0004 [uncultured bacterium]|nr:MAG: hypothetical protein ACD_11C00147G0004 [uncultured bacterium]